MLLHSIALRTFLILDGKLLMHPTNECQDKPHCIMVEVKHWK